MKKYADVFPTYLGLIFSPQGYLLLATAATLLAASVLRYIFGVAPAMLAVIGLGYGAYIADRKTFAAVPTYAPLEDEQTALQWIAVTSGGMVAFLGLAALTTPYGGWGIWMLLAILKLFIPAFFALLAYDEFRENVYPVLLRHENDREAYDREMTQKIEEAAIKKRAEQNREKAVTEARLRVLRFFDAHRPHLRERVDLDHLYVSCQAQIPDDSTATQAYSGADSLIANLQKHLADAKQKRQIDIEVLDAVDADIAKIREEIARVPSNPMYTDDLATQRSEVAALQKKIDALESRRRSILSRSKSN